MPEPEAQPERVQPPRNCQGPERLTYAQSKGKEKHVKFDITVNPEDVEEYDQQYAMLIANCMAEINAKATMYGSCYGQKYILQKGLKKFKKAGENASGRELEQVQKGRRRCSWQGTRATAQKKLFHANGHDEAVSQRKKENNGGTYVSHRKERQSN
ncbi:MAG: hypothetical protein ACP5NK_07920 [Thermoplasmata archaeon]